MYELYHHGILGMHWGIRRYQNSDGTLTPEGERRYLTNKKFRKKVDKLQTKNDEMYKKSFYNPDGTLSDNGIKAYMTSKAFRRKVDAKRQQEETYRKIAARENMKNLSDKEVGDFANRVLNEVKINDNLNKLVRDVPPTLADRAKKFVVDTTLKAGTKLFSELVDKTTAKIIKSAMSSMFDDESNNSSNNKKKKNKSNNNGN